MGDDCNKYFQRKSQIFGLASASGAAYVVNAANLAASSRGSRTDFRSEIPKEMKMPTPNEEFSELLVQMMAVHGSSRGLWSAD